MGPAIPKKKRRLLIVHGYAGCSAAYFTLFNELSKHFELTCIDLLGFGCSGRPNFTAQTVDDVIAFFLWQLRVWMDATGYDSEDKGPYSLFCHSMGCFFLTHWIVQNRHKIDRAYLMSVCGMQAMPEDFSVDAWVTRSPSVVITTLSRMARRVWGRHYSPIYPLKMTGYYGSRAFLRVWMQRIKNDDEKVKHLFIEHIR